MNIHQLLHYVVEHNASDLHLSSGVPPYVRIDEELIPVVAAPKLDEAAIRAMIAVILPLDAKENLVNKADIDIGIGIADLPARFRVNIFYQSRGISVAIRHIPAKIPTFADLGLAPIFYQLCNIQNGLILLTGPTGSGKSTTLAAMLDYLNSTQSSHIITIEDPIEYVYECKKSLVQQREVRRHTHNFDAALRSALREDPDYILVGEMRDLATIRLALTAAETGHLVFATLHTNSAVDSIDRMIDVFPTSEKTLIRLMLANSLQAVVSQLLLKKVGGGRVAAQEIMICNAAIRNLIRENKVQQIYSVIQTGQDKGMRTLAQHLQELSAQGVIDIGKYGHLVSD